MKQTAHQKWLAATKRAQRDFRAGVRCEKGLPAWTKKDRLRLERDLIVRVIRIIHRKEDIVD